MRSEVIPYVTSNSVDNLRDFINRSRIPKYVIIGNRMVEVDSFFGSSVFLRNRLEIYRASIDKFYDIQELFTLFQLTEMNPMKDDLVQRIVTIELRNTKNVQGYESNISIIGRPTGWGKDILDYILEKPYLKTKAQ